MVDGPTLQGYADLADLPEDDRISIIGHTVTERRHSVCIAMFTNRSASLPGNQTASQ